MPIIASSSTTHARSFVQAKTSRTNLRWYLGILFFKTAGARSCLRLFGRPMIMVVRLDRSLTLAAPDATEQKVFAAIVLVGIDKVPGAGENCVTSSMNKVVRITRLVLTGGNAAKFANIFLPCSILLRRRLSLFIARFGLLSSIDRWRSNDAGSLLAKITAVILRRGCIALLETMEDETEKFFHVLLI